jgi:hypothetical protein
MLVIFMMIILNFHFTHISRFSNVSCMSDELVKALNSGYGSSPQDSNSTPATIDNFGKLFQERQVDMFIFRVSFSSKVYMTNI